MEDKKQMNKMCQDKHIASQKLRQETKNFINSMILDGIPVTKKAVKEGLHLSNGFVNNPEITEYIKKAQELQQNQNLNIDKEYQNTILFRKLMASYNFQYALLNEEDAFLTQAIADMKELIAAKKEP